MEKKTIPLAVPDVGDEEINEIKKVFDTKFLTEGQTTKEFEEQVASYLGVKHAIAVTSCTTGLHAVFEGLDIKGQEVLVPDYTYPASAEAVVLAGGIPVITDVDIIKRGEDLIVEAKVHLVFVNKEGKPIKIPGTLFQDFKPYFCDTIKL